MDYLVAQIAVFLVLAALLGAAVGWLLRRSGRIEPPDDSVALTDAYRHIAQLQRSLAVYETARPVSAPDTEAEAREAL